MITTLGDFIFRLNCCFKLAFKAKLRLEPNQYAELTMQIGFKLSFKSKVMTKLYVLTQFETEICF